MTCDYDNLLIEAISDGNLETVIELLNNGANINARNETLGSEQRESALMIAAYYDQPEILQLLLDKGADIEAVDNEGRTALMESFQQLSLTCLELLLNAKANTEAVTNNSETAIILAASMYQFEHGVQMLIDYGADIHAVTKNGDEALMGAAFAGYIETAKVLINAGADINIKNNDEETPLIVAAKKGYMATTVYLIESGADIHAIDDKQDTAFNSAKLYGHKDVAEVIQTYMDHDYIVKQVSSELTQPTKSKPTRMYL